MPDRSVIKILVDNDLKITPQRIAVLEVVLTLENHPDADRVIDYIRLNFPHVSIGTVYKTLETFVKKGILKKVKTDNDNMRYDAIRERHHHLYCTKSDRIEDFYDEKLNELIDNYLSSKKIPDFNISEIKLQIVGEFTDNKKTTDKQKKKKTATKNS